jgi:hypothetical protein
MLGLFLSTINEVAQKEHSSVLHSLAVVEPPPYNNVN